jgi:hypothetical protein
LIWAVLDKEPRDLSIMTENRGAFEKIKRLYHFIARLRKHGISCDIRIRHWLVLEAAWARKQAEIAKCYHQVDLLHSPATGRPDKRNCDPFEEIFDSKYFCELLPVVCDMVEKAVAGLRASVLSTSSRKYRAFIAMQMSKDNPECSAILEAIKQTAQIFGVDAQRIDEIESNERITDRMLRAIDCSDLVIADVSDPRENVYYEAGWAHKAGKQVVFVARREVRLPFDIRDYPVVKFGDLEELKDGLARRLMVVVEMLGEQRSLA